MRSVPLIEISVSPGSFTSVEKLRFTRAVQRAFEQEYRAMRGRRPKCWVLIRESIDAESLLIDGMTEAEIRAKEQTG